MAESGIILGSGHEIATITIVSEDLYAKGGALSPALETAIDVALNPHAQFSLAVRSLSTELWLPMAGAGPVQVGAASRYERAGGFCSHESAVTRSSANARFPLTEAVLRLLDLHAGRFVPNPVPLEFRFSAQVSWVEWSANEMQKRPGTPDHPVPISYGVMLHHADFQTVQAHPLTLYVGREQWAERLLPALGLDRVRLVALRLPRLGGARGAEVSRLFDEARRHLDEGRNMESIHTCRALRHTVEEALGASKDRPIATVAAEARARTPDTPGHAFLAAMWEALAVFTNAASHPRGQTFTRADARACLAVCAAVIEHLADLITDGSDLT